MALRRFQIDIEGIAPLLLSSNKSSDPLSKEAKLRKHFTSKRTKVDEDHMNLRVLDWVYSGYWQIPGEVILNDTDNSLSFDGYKNLYIPDQNFSRCLKNGAAPWRLGKETTRALIVENSPLIEYDGPETAEEMWGDPRFCHNAPTVRMGKTNWVSRLVVPHGWRCSFKVLIDDERITPDQLEKIVSASGRFEGLGTWRPRFGRFQSVLNEVEMN